MERRLLYLCTWLIVFVGLVGSEKLIAQSITIGTSIPPTCVSPGASIAVSFSTSGVFGIGNTFTVQLSDNGGTFPASPVTITSRSVSPSTPTTYTLTGTFPAGASTGGYKIRVVSSVPARTSSTLDIGVQPAAPAAGISSPSGPICQGTPISLTASGNNLKWFGPPNGNLVANNTSSYSPENLAPGTYIYTVTQLVGLCESPGRTITVVVNARPSAPLVTTPQPYCQGNATQQLQPSGAGYRWYNANGTLLPNNGAAPAHNISTPGSTTYLVSAVNNSCESTQRSPLVVNVTNSPTTLAPVSLAYCETSRPSSLTVGGINVKWYSDANGINQITAPSPPVAPGAYTYYVRQFDSNNCGSAPSAYGVRVLATPAAPAVSPADLTRCLNDAPRQLSISSALPGSTITWFDNAGTTLPSAPVPPTSATGTITYRVQQTTTDGCTGPRATVLFTVNSVPAAPNVTPPAAFCEGRTPPTLSASGSGALRWYGQNATGGNFTNTPPLVNNNQVGTANYYVSQVVNNCESPRTAIPVTVKDTPGSPGVSNLAFCQNSPAPGLNATTVPNASLQWATSASGPYSSTPPSVPNGTAQTINYYVFQQLDGCDGPQAILSVTVRPLPSAPSTTPLNLCHNGPTRSVQAQGVNLRYYDPSGNLSGNTPSPPTNNVGTFTYQVTQTINDCEGPRSPLTVNVFALPSAPGVSDLAYCQPQTDQPSQSVGPVTAQGQNLRWYNTDGNLFGGGAPTPPIDQPRSIRYLVSQTVNNCEGPRSTLTVTVRTTSAPVVSVTSVSYCRNDQATPLQATAEPGASLRWLDPNNNLTNDAPTPITLNVTAPGGRVFYVYQIGANGCYSPRSSIRLFVNTNPTLSLLGSTTVNLGRTASLQLRFTGVPPFNYTLSDGTAGVANDTIATVGVMPPQTTVFQVASVTNICGQGLPGNPATATVFVRVPTIITGALPSSVVCAGTGFFVPFTTSGDFNPGNIFRVEIATDTTSRASTTVGIGTTQVGPIGVSIPSSLSAGLYYVRVVGSNPGIAVRGKPSPVLLNVRPLPSATLSGTQDVYEGSVAKLNVAFTGDGPWVFAYADSLRSMTVTTNANPHTLEVSPIKTNTYRLLSVLNNCGDGNASGTAIVRVLPLLGIEDDHLSESVKAFPVPTTSVLTIDIDLPLQQNPANLSLTDIGGKTFLQHKTRSRQTTLDLSNQPAGLYLLKIQVGDKQTTRRIVKQ